MHFFSNRVGFISETQVTRAKQRKREGENKASSRLEKTKSSGGNVMRNDLGYTLDRQAMTQKFFRVITTKQGNR